MRFRVEISGACVNHSGKQVSSSLQVIERRIRVGDDLATGRRVLRSDNLGSFLPLSTSSVLAHGLLLDLDLREERVLRLLVSSLLVQVQVILGIIVKLTHSPIRCVVILLFLRGHGTWTTSEFLRIEDLVRHTALRVHHLSLLVFSRGDQTCTKRVDLRLDLLLSLSGLLFSEFLVHVLVDFLWTLSRGRCTTGHLLTHHLLESAVLLELQDPLRFVLLLALLLLFLPQSVDVGFGQYACFMRLPLNFVKLLESFLLHKNLRAICAENLEPIIDLQPLVQHRVQQVTTARRPLNLNGAWELGLAYFLVRLQVPKVHLTLRDVAKATNH